MKKELIALLIGFSVLTTISFTIPNQKIGVTTIKNDFQSCKIDDNLDKMVRDFIGSCVKGSVWSVFPGGTDGSYARMYVREIKDKRSDNDDYKTVWKLISRDEYRK